VGDALLARRIVLVHGEIDQAKASEVGAALMTIDALGDEHVELRVTSGSGSFDAALVLLDVIDVVGVPVHTVGTGVISGGAVGVVAAGFRRALPATPASTCGSPTWP
jgi:ATP-dependent Clp protease protease subunit